MKIVFPFLLALGAGLLLSPPALSQQAPAASPVTFTDVAAAAGLTFTHDAGATPEKRMFETFGSGVAWIDFDDDGWPDLFFAGGAAGHPNALFRNRGDGTFADVTDAAGVAGPSTSYRTGVAVGDVDNDGDLDLYVAAHGPNVLYRNDGDGRFTDVTAAAGVAGGSAWSSSAGFFDYDRDGDLDLFVANYLDDEAAGDPYCGFRKEGYRTYCNPTLFDGVADRLFRNRGDGTFEDVSAAAGVANPAGKGLGVVFCDVDSDGWQDVYVANDLVRNFLYRNQRDGTFKDIAYGAGVGFDANGKPQAGMGVECGDVNSDGRFDLFVTNFSDELNSLYINLGEGVFEERASQLGLGSGFLPLGFGTRLFDMDNDGDLDIYVTNGHVIDNVALYTKTASYAQRDLVYANAGGRFTDVTAAAGPGLEIERVGRGLAAADYDNDGDVDLIIANLNAAPVLLRNDSPRSHHWLSIRARGRASNRFGLGARISIAADGQTQVREVSNVGSYLSAHDTRLHVGLGAAAKAEQIEVVWPSGARQVLTDVAGDRVLTIEEPESPPPAQEAR